MIFTRIPLLLLVSASLAVATLAPAASSVAESTAGSLDILSSRADLVTGSNVLVGLADKNADGLAATANGTPVDARFAAMRGKLVGEVSGLPAGSVKLVIKRKGVPVAAADLIVHHAGAPLLYPRTAPWGCDGGAVDADCGRPGSFSYYYKSTDPKVVGLKPYDPARGATDIATASPAAGVTVPFIVRIETGVIDRDYYNIAVLYDPSRSWSALAPQPAWNGKLVLTHGAGYGLGFSQLASVTSANVRNLHALEKGFAVASTALGDNGHNGNIAIQAEATSLLKEHFVKGYGPIRYTIAMGNSGGSLTSYSLANAYPGLFDGLVVGYSFPDPGSSLVETEDCSLLANYFSRGTDWSNDVRWTRPQMLAVAGHAKDVCASWIDHTRPKPMGLSTDLGYPQIFQPSHGGTIFYPGIAPTAIGGCDAPADKRYIAEFNPKGVRCTAQDYVAAILGKRTADGFANRPYSNVGVQYGLVALNAGTISVNQFLDLNAKIGAHDIDYDFQAERVHGDGVAAAYRSGWINSANGLTTVAIIDIRRPDLDSIHHQFRSWSVRARIDRAQGNHRNHVIWYDTKLTMDEGLDAMDAWLEGIDAGNHLVPMAKRIASARPVTLTDLCGTRNGDELSMVQCTEVADGSVRMAAGEALTDDAIDCKLVRPDRRAYRVAFTAEQWTRLSQVFAQGVCDYTVAGKDQQPAQPWQAYLGSVGQL